MYAIVACDEKNVNVVRGFIVENLANSLGENTTEDMSTVETLVDSLNSEEGCRVYLGFGISPASAKEKCIHNVLSWGFPVESIINERLPLTYFVVSLKPGRNPHVGDVLSAFACRFAPLSAEKKQLSTITSCLCASRGLLERLRPQCLACLTIVAEYGFKILPYPNSYCQGHRTDLHKSYTNPKNIKKHKLSIVGRKNYTLPQLICQEKLF